MVEVVTTDDFDRWLRKLKDRQGRLQILFRTDRLAYGNAGDVKAVGQSVLENSADLWTGLPGLLRAHRGNRVVPLHCGGDKSTQSNHLAKAHQLAAEWHAMEDDNDY